jgi:hypothetical protein
MNAEQFLVGREIAMLRARLRPRTNISRDSAFQGVIDGNRILQTRVAELERQVECLIATNSRLATKLNQFQADEPTEAR